MTAANGSPIANAMQGVPEEIVERQLAYFRQADADYGTGIANRLGQN